MTFSNRHERAAWLDEQDPLAGCRDAFHQPVIDGQPHTYFCGHSLGLMPKAAEEAVQQELNDWRTYGVEGHFEGHTPWLDYHRQVTEGLAEVVGAQPSEVVAMNTLTTNLHLMMASFYRPTPQRAGILIERDAFPSDRYAAASQIDFHGYDPEAQLISVDGDETGGVISEAAMLRAIEQHGQRIALVLLPGVQYLTGQAFDLKEITQAAHAQGCMVGFDLAHAVGNLPLQLHDSGADFAVWCHYKYMNSGPGAVAGAFVHERHANFSGKRFEGWWGHRESTRFLMNPNMDAAEGVEGWQLSNPPIFSLAPLIASLAQFTGAGMPRLREKSELLTGLLHDGIVRELHNSLECITPERANRRGCQLSVRVKGGVDAGRSLFVWLKKHHILCDWREPDILRFAPVPLYNRFADVSRLLDVMGAWESQR